MRFNLTIVEGKPNVSLLKDQVMKARIIHSDSEVIGALIDLVASVTRKYLMEKKKSAPVVRKKGDDYGIRNLQIW